MLGRLIPLRTARRGGYFFVQRQDGTIQASLDIGAYQAAAPVLPEKVEWTPKAMDSIKRVYLNNQYGCCVISSLWHIVGLWTGNDLGAALTGPDSEVLATYRIWNPRGDNGCDISVVNNYWRDHGVTINGKIHKIDGYVSVDTTKPDLVKAALAIFGNIKLGIDLPGEWENNNTTWDVTNSRVVGGHDVPAFDFSPAGVVISTWGGLRTITWAAFTSTRWLSEAYACLGSDWYNEDMTAPNGIDVATLKADLQAVANGQIPSVGPPEVPLDWLI